MNTSRREDNSVVPDRAKGSGYGWGLALGYGGPEIAMSRRVVKYMFDHAELSR
jgi:hypothetical protein